MWKNEKFTLTKRNISSNQLYSNLFSRTATFPKFLPKLSEREFPKFPHCVRKSKIKRDHTQIFREINS